MVYRWLVGLACLAGCDRVFGLDAPHPDAAGGPVDGMIADGRHCRTHRTGAKFRSLTVYTRD